MTLPSPSLMLLIFIAFISCKSKEYGCYDGDTCILSSEENNFMNQDELYCTSSVTSCNIYCYSPNSCQSLVIYSSAQSTNIICNATSSCHNTTIRIGDTSRYPLLFKSKHFSNLNPTKSNIDCQGQQSCSSLMLYFDGTEKDEITIFSTNINAFYNGFFDCNLNIHTNEYNEDNSTIGCNLYCANKYTNECSDVTFDCNLADDTYCKCNGDGCNTQSIDIVYDNTTISTTHIITTTIHPTEPTAMTETFFESDMFTYVVIGIVILVFCLAGCLIICCWKFEAMYDCYEGRKVKKLQIKHIASHSHEFHNPNQYHSKQNSQTVSNSQSGGNTNNITDEEPKHIELTTHANTKKTVGSYSTNSTIIGMDTARERMPSSWYKYKQQQAGTHLTHLTSNMNGSNIIQSPTMTGSIISNLSPELKPLTKPMAMEHQAQKQHNNQENMTLNEDYTSKKKPMKQNKKRKKSSNKNDKGQGHNYCKNKEYKMKEYKKVKIKQQTHVQKRDHRKDESESDPLSTEDDSDSDTDSSSTEGDSESDTDSSSSGSSGSDSDSESEANKSKSKDGDNAEETTETVNGINIDDMMVNMVMMIQKTPVEATPNDDKNDVPVSFPNIPKAETETKT